MLLCPSMMCADFTNVKEEVGKLEKAGADIFHCDIIDGVYADNLGLSLLDIRAIRASTYRRLDVHLMIKDPLKKIKWFIDAGADIVYFHPETETDPKSAIKLIHDLGAEAGLVINPDISVDSLHDLILMSDYVLLMTVKPGFSGQKFLDFVRNKIPELLELKKQRNFNLILDGAISPAIVGEFSKIGIDGFILGTTSLFSKSKTYAEIMENLRVHAK
jgi:ribulose-phosphate 3-epimerase